MKLVKITAPASRHASATGICGYVERKQPIIWIVIADQWRIRVFKKSTHGIDPFAEIKPFYDAEIGCGFSEKARFAHEFSNWLDKSVQDNLFDRLIIVASSKMLGEFRKQLSKEVQARIAAEVGKELTKLNETQLQIELEKIVWF